MRRAIVLLCLVAAAGAGQAPATEDWTEAGGSWHTQSYWRDPNILQKYTFTPNTADKVVGRSSVEVRMQVAAERPRNMVELRLVPPKPLDLSQAEALEVSLKMLGGATFQPRDVFLCSPGYKKLAIVRWPPKLKLAPGGDWQRAVLDLTDARVLDKAKPGPDGEYDRRDVAVICLNFLLPDAGAVDARLLIDGLRATSLPPPAVKSEKRPDGSFVFTTARYRAVVGANGYLQTLRAGPTEFLRPEPGAACYVGNNPAKGTIALKPPRLKGRRHLLAQGEQASIRYEFREDDFDVVLKQTFTKAGLLWFPLSAEVVAALDGRTDLPLLAAKLEQGPQIDTRLVTTTGGVLACKQHLVGYSRMSTGVLPGKVWAYRFLAYGAGPCKLTLRPMGEPAAPDAVGLRVECRDPDFLLPGGSPSASTSRPPATRRRRSAADSSSRRATTSPASPSASASPPSSSGQARRCPCRPTWRSPNPAPTAAR